MLTKQNNIFLRFSTEKIRELHSYYENIYLSIYLVWHIVSLRDLWLWMYGLCGSAREQLLTYSILMFRNIYATK